MIFTKRVMWLSLIFSLLMSPESLANQLDGKWQFWVGAKQLFYQAHLKVEPYPSEIAPLGGYLLNPQGQKFPLKKCAPQALAVEPTGIFIQVGQQKIWADCSYTDIVGDMGTAHCCKTRMVLREGDRAWLIEFDKHMNFKNGQVYHVHTGQLQATFRGQKSNP